MGNVGLFYFFWKQGVEIHQRFPKIPVPGLYRNSTRRSVPEGSIRNSKKDAILLLTGRPWEPAYLVAGAWAPWA